MLSRLQRFTTLLILATSLIWAAYFIRADRPAWAIGGALLIAFGYALVLGAEFVLLWRANRSDPAPRATVLQLVIAWLGEACSAPAVFCWRQPFRPNAEPDLLRGGDGRRGVVLVHGFVCNRGLWTPWMTKLRARGVPFIAVNLEPVFCSIDDYAPIIDDAVRRLGASTGLAPVIVCHSMGGMAARAWLDAMRGDDRVHRIVTIGTPHGGTWLGRFAHTLNGRQMNIGSDWLVQMTAREPARRPSLFICFHSNCDNIVFPTSTGSMRGADNRLLTGWAHVRMIHHPAVLAEVLNSVGSRDSDA